MPELPDLAVLAEALHTALAGRPVLAVELRDPLVVRGTPAEARALVGQRLVSIGRRGKFLLFDLARDRIVLNPMLSGRLQLAFAGAAGRSGPRAREGDAVALRFGHRDGPPGTVADWTRGAAWIPGDGEEPELRYRDRRRMGKLYISPAGVTRQIPGWDEQGPDADDTALTLGAWRERIRRHPGELKQLLRHQAFVAGIGNAYSDEILHAARLSPFRRRASLSGEEVDALYEAARSVLAAACATLRRVVPPAFDVEVRDHLAVHGRGGAPCPRCGTRLTELTAGGEITTFCRACQR